MPYISKESRETVDSLINQLIDVVQIEVPNNRKGLLNYIITRLLSGGFEIPDEIRYSKINDIVGVLECAKLEFYQRIARNFEDEKMHINGDVSEYQQKEANEKRQNSN